MVPGRHWLTFGLRRIATLGYFCKYRASPLSRTASRYQLSISHLDIQNKEEIAVVHMNINEVLKSKIVKVYRQDELYQEIMTNSKKAMAFEIVDDLVLRKSKNKVKQLCIPDDEEIKIVVLQNHHDAVTTAHPGTYRTYMKIKQWFWWPNMKSEIISYVKTCQVCLRHKSSSQKKQGMMKSLPIPQQCWESVSMDFITQLPESEGYDAIANCVCRLSKRAVYIPTQTDITAEGYAKLFFNHVVRTYGIPKEIISDRDSKFISKFWKSLMEIMGIKLAMTVAHRAQGDGQVERQNRVLEDSLRCFVSFHGKDWSAYLPAIEYAHATLVASTTGYSPFYLDTGRLPRDPMIEFDGLTSIQHLNEFAYKFAKERQVIITQAKKSMKRAQERQAEYYNKKRSPEEFDKGDWVLLATENLNLFHATNNPKVKSRKLAPRYIGPYCITRKLSRLNYEHQLPKTMPRLHKVFNIEHLKRCPGNPVQFSRRPLRKIAPVIIDAQGQELHIVEALQKFHVYCKKREFLVKWAGLPESENTWEYESTIKHVSHWQELLKDFKLQLQVNRGRV